MSRLTWSEPGERFFETGVDRGVLYVNGASGVPWVGLISVNEAPTGGEIRAFYQDGIKYLVVTGKEHFEATLDAFMYPPEFELCDGTVQLQNGLFVTQQTRTPFGLSYRTLVGNDIDGIEHGYKIHLVYNALASPSPRSNTTMSSNVEANTFSWSLETKPVIFMGGQPTAHFVVDSRHTPSLILQTIEDILYGSDAETARLPTVEELLSIFVTPARVDGGVSDSIHTLFVDGGLAEVTHTLNLQGGTA